MRIHSRLLIAASLLLVTAFVPPFAAGQSGSAPPAADAIFAAIGVREGATVCEIGAGEGAMTIAAARAVGPSGRVYSNELGESRAKALQDKIAASGAAHITVVAGDATSTNLPDAACDALFLRDVYHHLTEPAAMTASIEKALKPGARVAVIDFTPPGAEAPHPADRGKDGMHGVSPATVIREMQEAGLEPVSAETSHRWFMLVLAKKTAGPASF